MIRPSLQLLLLFFALPCLVVSLGARNLRRLLLVGIPAAALILATVAGDHLRLEMPGALALATFNKARSLLVDIPRDPTPAALAAAGWSRGDYEMAVRFGMYDEELYQVGSESAPSWRRRARRRGSSGMRARPATISSAGSTSSVSRRFCASSGSCGPGPAARQARTARRSPPAHSSGRGSPRGPSRWSSIRFPPRVFVPLYFYLGALAILAPPPLPRFSLGVPASGPARTVALGAVAALLCFSMVFWLADARAGRARLEADARELAAGAAAAGPDAILVPVGQLLETQYAGALTPGTFQVTALIAPAGWVVATPAFGDFLARAGFASGHAFMRGLVLDRRMVFVVRRSRQGDAQWLIERLNERYAPGARLGIEPLESSRRQDRDSCFSGSALCPA